MVVGGVTYSVGASGGIPLPRESPCTSAAWEYLSSHELSKARGEGQCGDDQSDQCWEEQASGDGDPTVSGGPDMCFGAEVRDMLTAQLPV